MMPKEPYIPFTRLENLVLWFVWFCLGAAAGVIVATFPHPTLAQRNIGGLAMIIGTITFVVFAIYRINKEWKLRTGSATSN
jgi:hypothetical protein